MTFLTILGVMEILCSSRLVLEGKTGKGIPESSRFEFLEKFLANNFPLSDAKNKTSGPSNRGGIADLPLLRTLLAIRQKSREFLGSDGPFCFSSICKFGRTLLYFRFRRFIVDTNEKSDFYELWQQQKLLKTMEMSEV